MKVVAPLTTLAQVHLFLLEPLQVHVLQKERKNYAQRRGLRKGMGSGESLPPLPTEGEREATQKLPTLPAGYVLPQL